MPGPLVDLRILDLSRILAGPWATQVMADLGAEVIKIERPESGDDTRSFGPPFLPALDGSRGQSAYFLSANRGKRSVTINLTHPEGTELVRELVTKCDILIENFKVGSLEKLGLDYKALASLNPRLIYCSITGFGQCGPYCDRAGYDLVIQAMSGLMSITGFPTGEPTRSGVAISDILTGLYCTTAVLAALHEREKSGLGQYIDLALLDVQVACLANQAASFLVTGEVPTRYGNAHPTLAPYEAFDTRDGEIIVAVANDVQFGRFTEILGMPQLAEEPRFLTNADRVGNRDVLIPMIASRLRERTTCEWLEEFNRALIPAGKINSIDAVFADPQVKARNLVMHFPSDGESDRQLVGNPIRLSRTPVSYELPPPELGAHTDEVLAELLGKSQEAIQRLRGLGAI